MPCFYHVCSIFQCRTFQTLYYFVLCICLLQEVDVQESKEVHKPQQQIVIKQPELVRRCWRLLGKWDQFGVTLPYAIKCDKMDTLLLQLLEIPLNDLKTMCLKSISIVQHSTTWVGIQFVVVDITYKFQILESVIFVQDDDESTYTRRSTRRGGGTTRQRSSRGYGDDDSDDITQHIPAVSIDSQGDLLLVVPEVVMLCKSFLLHQNQILLLQMQSAYLLCCPMSLVLLTTTTYKHFYICLFILMSPLLFFSGL